MDALSQKQESRFLHLVKRIWDGPMGDFTEEEWMESELADIPHKEWLDTAGKVAAELTEPAVIRKPAEKKDPVPDGREPAKSQKNVTVIASDTVVFGDIRSEGDIDILGTVHGAVISSGTVKIGGKQYGDVQGLSIYAGSCTIRGNLTASEEVSADTKTVIVGSVKCKNLRLGGKLRGNIDVSENVNCGCNAVVIGDITSKTITLETGAKLSGKLKIADGSMEQFGVKDEAETVSLSSGT
ncbi:MULTISPECIES: bactofilin family protein [Acutalibacteraceae]|uniref:bactofilin family protein n=1 Tax=Acutalibacteraceae TaxID=3082771 RepID=UPI0013E8CB2C|nr:MULTISPECIES: polymer-forming cytoskeletal protein [Acutalibacteraceae]